MQCSVQDYKNNKGGCLIISSKKEIVKILADIETGETIEIHKGDKLKITSLEQRNAIQKSIKTKELNELTKEWNSQFGGFVFILFKYSNLILEKNKEITPEDITKLFYLSTYVDYNGFIIYEDSQMNKTTMMKILNIKKRRFDTFFKRMKDANIFIYENKIIKINTDYFIKGVITRDIHLNNNFTRLYINSIRFIYENVNISSHSQLGIYFKLIPYIHRQRNLLCHNPDCYEDDIKLMNVNELKNILGYHRNGVRKFINSLLSIKLNNGESILVSVKNDPDEGKSFIIINPKVIYGGNFDLKKGQQIITKWFMTTKEMD